MIKNPAWEVSIPLEDALPIIRGQVNFIKRHLDHGKTLRQFIKKDPPLLRDLASLLAYLSRPEHTRVVFSQGGYPGPVVVKEFAEVFVKAVRESRDTRDRKNVVSNALFNADELVMGKVVVTLSNLSRRLTKDGSCPRASVNMVVNAKNRLLEAAGLENENY